MKKGLFIVFEGIDGSGKTTQAKLLVDKLNKKNNLSMYTKEPTNSELGELIYKNLKTSSIKNTTAQEQYLSNLLLADRYEHIFGNNGINSFLEKGYNVICDRYHLSFLAYNETIPIEKYVWSWSIPYPDITFLLNVDITSALIRINSRSVEKSIYENEEKLFNVGIRFIKLANCFNYEMPIYQFDGSLNKDELHNQIYNCFQNEFIVS